MGDTNNTSRHRFSRYKGIPDRPACLSIGSLVCAGLHDGCESPSVRGLGPFFVRTRGDTPNIQIACPPFGPLFPHASKMELLSDPAIIGLSVEKPETPVKQSSESSSSLRICRMGNITQLSFYQSILAAPFVFISSPLFIVASLIFFFSSLVCTHPVISSKPTDQTPRRSRSG